MRRSLQKGGLQVIMLVLFKSRPFTGVGIGNFSAYRVPNIDGIPLQAHNLEGQLLGEMGSLGVCAFLLMIGATLVNCRITARLSKFQNDIKMMLLGDLARACMVSLILLVFLGTFAHNLFRYNWLWLAAFSVLALQFQKDMLKRKEVVDVYN
jgi:O-antigen ligase